MAKVVANAVNNVVGKGTFVCQKGSVNGARFSITVLAFGAIARRKAGTFCLQGRAGEAVSAYGVYGAGSGYAAVDASDAVLDKGLA